MDKSAFKENINKVEEMVLDEDKLVTYISLSKDLCLHVNESKLLLNETIKQIKIKRPESELKVSYILSGISEGNSAHTLVCTEEEAVKLRKKFFKIVFFDHVYSISSSVSEVDKVAFLAINKFDDFTLCTGFIKNSVCIRHTSDEIGKLKLTSQNIEKNDQKPVIVNKKNNMFENKNCMDYNDNSEVNKAIEIKKENSPKTDLSTTVKPNHEKKNTNSSQKGIAGFFTKSNGNLGAKSVGNDKICSGNKDSSVEQKQNKVEKMVIVNKTLPKIENIDRDNEHSVKKELSPNGEIKRESHAKVKSSKLSALNQIKKNAKVDSKRKRVLHVSDSESDDDQNDPFKNETVTNNESDDEIPPTPTVNTVKITSGFVNPKKKRKIIDKTYTDDEGYILTKKVEVYESCSENEEEISKENVKSANKPQISPEVKKNDIKNKKKVTPPQKGKQSTLMSFFKKT